MKTTSAVFLLSLTIGGCGSSSPRPVVAKPDANEGGQSVPIASMSGDPASTTPVAAGGACTEPTNLRPAPDRDKGIEAFLLDRPREAVDLLTIAIKNDPRDRAAEAFRAAAQAKLDEGRTRALDDVSGTRRVSLESIPLAHIERKAVPLGAQTTKVQLTKSSETKNLITDTADWESKNQLKSNARHQNDLPANVPPKLGQMERLRVAFQHADHVAAIYDSTILIASEGKRALSFDTRMVRSRGPRPFEIPFAQMVGSALIVELAYNGYAKDSNGRNGYFAAFDVKDGTLMWATDPLVANAHEAIISGGSIITGYGFTAEPDFLFVLDLATGKVDQKIPLKSGPSFIRKNADRLFVRTYDMDYVFKPASSFAAAPPANLSGVENATASDVPPPDAETKCWVHRATAAILARDAQGIHEANERLKPISRDRVLDELLRIEEKKAAMVSTSGRLDLTAAPLIAVAAPPWDATPPKPPTPGVKVPRLVKVVSKAADPIRNMHPAFDPSKPWSIAPVKKGQLPEGARQDIPTSFGQEDLRAIIPDQRGANERSILIYGGRYLALVKADVAERVFDLETLRHPPKANPQWKEFAIQDATYAQERDGVLYVCNGGGSYAKEVFGKKGFLTALDVATGKLIWRSAPLMCNSTFAMTNDHIISGYGFTAEPDFVFLVRRSDGAMVQRVPIDTGPESITLTGTQVHVETYGHVADFELKF